MKKLTPKLSLERTVIEFKIGDDLHKFTVVHNLPEISGLSLDDAVCNWFVRTKDYSADSLCKYIMSKETDYVCMTEDQFKKISDRLF